MPDWQSQDRAGGFLGAEIEAAELEDEREGRLAGLVAIVNFVPSGADEAT